MTLRARLARLGRIGPERAADPDARRKLAERLERLASSGNPADAAQLERIRAALTERTEGRP